MILSTNWNQSVVALVGQATGFLATGYREGAKEQMLAVGFLSLAQALSGFQYGGFVVNHLDIAPRYAGTLFGISNTFATVSGIVAPLVATSLTPQVHNLLAFFNSNIFFSTTLGTYIQILICVVFS